MPNPPSAHTAAVLTLGCKLNIADSEAMARRLRDAGWHVVDRAGPADAVIVNTCSVTHVADRKARRIVRQARRLAPEATVALTGCLLETAPGATLDNLGADLIRRQPDQAALIEQVIDLHPGAASVTIAAAPALRTRSFVAAQEGCNDVCAFCIVPRTRGRERSKAIADVIAAVRLREAEGAQEVVITGTQLGAYGRDLAATAGDVHPKPHDLLVALLRETKAPRLRMSSLQPQDISDELIGLWRNPRLCRHFHLALQSGSEGVLQRMRRRYTSDQYRDAVLRLRAAIPDIAITSDVIVGFPGETRVEFDESYEFCREMAFAGMHVFPYSQRDGTLAAKMRDQIADQIKQDRVHRLITLGDEMATAYRARYLNTTATALWEASREHEGRDIWEGLTDTYVRVYAEAEAEADLRNRITPVALRSVYGDGLWGEVAL